MADTGLLEAYAEPMLGPEDELDREYRKSPRKKPRITLPRGHACVACRQATETCQEGIRPCITCVKANIDCRDEEIPRKKPRHVVLEERVAELEGLLGLQKGQPVPRKSNPSSTTFSGYSASPSPSEHFFSEYPQVSSSHTVNPYLDHPPLSVTGRPTASSQIEIPPGSAIELSLIQFILPYTPYLLLPLHPQRFLASLSLPPEDNSRPHPALLYTLFSHAVSHLERGIPPPYPPDKPMGLFPSSPPPPFPIPTLSTGFILSHLRGTSGPLLARARLELDQGIRGVDRLFDLTRAAIGIAHALYRRGNFVEGWTMPVANLVVACGLHRISGNCVPPPTSSKGIQGLPQPYAHPDYYLHAHTPSQVIPDRQELRMRPVLIPPARDEIEIAERVMTFWASKHQMWISSGGWGWSDPLSDAECTTEWPWGWGHVEPSSQLRAVLPLERYTLNDIHDPDSNIHTGAYADTTHTLAMKSMALLCRAGRLFDLPKITHPTSLSNEGSFPFFPHIPPIEDVESVEICLALFRQHIPLPFIFPPPVSTANGPAMASAPLDTEIYDGPSDPWWILFHFNLYAAEMLMWREMAFHRPESSGAALQCARALVNLTRSIPDEKWANVDMMVAFSISLAARLLVKEAARFQASGALTAAAHALADADILQNCLDGPFNRYMEVAGGMFSRIVDNVREGRTEKNGEYERV
ncbi:hypothetical protein CNBC3890 [Cryptococcus deneoformans B-3501A]|uniref:hypothetical protein n=1 Tax=Cryptococcus deneoformans (strain B-3501A) TaxID=283643 RepID=UPI000042F026|nr:hypothetical protein CNBC3890 [Cryptococcus neoformans var. neoformans B-3501A]EAL22251.1 hypothetical protein CNBC3890 [Cryptococcus neoformans var. neoformans B-3501A]